MRLIDGGIRMPSVPPAASEPRKMRWLYRFFSIRLTATVPMVAAVATLEPQVAANSEHCPHVGVHQAARQPRHPLRHRAVHPFRNAGAEENFADDPIWFGIVIVLLIETAMITPPVGINLFVVQGVRARGEIRDVIIRRRALRDCSPRRSRADRPLSWARDLASDGCQRLTLPRTGRHRAAWGRELPRVAAHMPRSRSMPAWQARRVRDSYARGSAGNRVAMSCGITI
jgi:hypothetical protein